MSDFAWACIAGSIAMICIFGLTAWRDWLEHRKEK